MKHHLLDNDSHLRCEQSQNLKVIFRISVKFIAFEIKDANYLGVRDYWRYHLRTRFASGIDVVWILAHVGGSNWLGGQRYLPDKSFAKFQVEVRQFINVIPSDSFRLKHAGLFAFGNCALIDTLHDKDPGRIIRNQRIEGVHYEVENFLQVQRTADLLCDVEQHPQLVCGSQTRQRKLSCLFTHYLKLRSKTIPTSLVGIMRHKAKTNYMRSVPC